MSQTQNTFEPPKSVLFDYKILSLPWSCCSHYTKWTYLSLSFAEVKFLDKNLSTLISGGSFMSTFFSGHLPVQWWWGESGAIYTPASCLHNGDSLIGSHLLEMENPLHKENSQRGSRKVLKLMCFLVNNSCGK